MIRVLSAGHQDEVQYVGVSNDVAETVKVVPRAPASSQLRPCVEQVDVPCFELERASLLGTLRERLSQQGTEKSSDSCGMP